MTFVDQIKSIGQKLGINVTGSNVADALRSLEAGVSAKSTPVKTAAPAPATEAPSQPVTRRSKRERVEKTEE